MAAFTIAPIPHDAIDLAPEPPEFETLATIELGNAATPSDGFDAIMAEAVTVAASSQGDLADAQQAEMEAAAQFPALVADEATPLVTELAAADSEGSGVLSEFETDMGIIEPPPPVVTPPTPVTPVPTGGGGGGGDPGGGGGGGDSLYPILDPCPNYGDISGPICGGEIG